MVKIWIRGGNTYSMLTEKEWDKLYPKKERTHGALMAKQNANLSEAEIRAKSCMRSKERNSKRKAERRQQAEERNARYAQLNWEQRLKSWNTRFGVGKGAKRERAKLEAKFTPPSN